MTKHLAPSLLPAGVTESVAGPRAVWELLRRYPRTTASAGVLLGLAGLAEGVGLLALLPLLSLAVEGESVQMPAVGDAMVSFMEWLRLDPTIGTLLAVIVGGIALKGGLRILALWRVGAAEAAITADMRRAMIQGFLHARWPYFVTQPAGSLANAVGNETMRAAKVLTMSAQTAAAGFPLIVYAALAVVVSWWVAVIGALVGLFAARGLRFLVRMSKAAGKEMTRTQNALISRLNDVLYTIKPLKAMGREDSVRPMIDSDICDFERAQRRTVVSRASVQGAYEPIAALALAVLVYALMVLIGLPFEQLLFIAFLVHRTVMNVGKVQRNWQELQNHQYALRVVSGTLSRLEREREPVGGDSVPQLERELRFEGVSFAHAEVPVLDDFSLTVPAGELTAVIGPSGVGKTTLVDLVIGLQRPQAGRITVDGTSLSDVDLDAWRAGIGYVPQDTVLLHETIMANLVLGDEHLGEDEVFDALDRAGVGEYVRSLPDGVQTVVGEHGMRLSGGQRQRLAIARALLRKPRLLILDEATTALDPATEADVLQHLARYRGGLTILAISHQRGIVDTADRVVEMAGAGAKPLVRIGGAADAAPPEELA